MKHQALKKAPKHKGISCLIYFFFFFIYLERTAQHAARTGRKISWETFRKLFYTVLKLYEIINMKRGLENNLVKHGGFLRKYSYSFILFLNLKI